MDFRNYSKRINVFSGNLDARSIRLLLEAWGIWRDFHVDGEEKLLIIKNHRNILAHGEKSFREIGRNYTVLEIEKFSECVFQYLSALIKCFSEYIGHEQYIKQ